MSWVKVVPNRRVAMGLLLMLCVGLLILWGAQPSRAAAQSLQVTAVIEPLEEGLTELVIRWSWLPTSPLRRGQPREHLLAVSYDTQILLFEAETASAGVGANGDALGRLQRIAGPNGARRLFVLPDGVDGEVRLRLRLHDHDQLLTPDLIGLHVVFDYPTADIWRIATQSGITP